MAVISILAGTTNTNEAIQQVGSSGKMKLSRFVSSFLAVNVASFVFERPAPLFLCLVPRKSSDSKSSRPHLGFGAAWHLDESIFRAAEPGLQPWYKIGERRNHEHGRGGGVQSRA